MLLGLPWRLDCRNLSGGTWASTVLSSWEMWSPMDPWAALGCSDTYDAKRQAAGGFSPAQHVAIAGTWILLGSCCSPGLPYLTQMCKSRGGQLPKDIPWDVWDNKNSKNRQDGVEHRGRKDLHASSRSGLTCVLFAQVLGVSSGAILLGGWTEDT